MTKSVSTNTAVCNKVSVFKIYTVTLIPVFSFSLQLGGARIREKERRGTLCVLRNAGKQNHVKGRMLSGILGGLFCNTPKSGLWSGAKETEKRHIIFNGPSLLSFTGIFKVPTDFCGGNKREVCCFKTQDCLSSTTLWQ